MVLALKNELNIYETEGRNVLLRCAFSPLPDNASITHTCAGNFSGAIGDFVDDDDDLEDALKHLIFDLLITSTFKVEVQKQFFEQVQSMTPLGFSF